MISRLTRLWPALMPGVVRSSYGAPQVRTLALRGPQGVTGLVMWHEGSSRRPWRPNEATNLLVVIHKRANTAQLEHEQRTQHLRVRLVLKGGFIVTEGQVKWFLFFVIVGGRVYSRVLSNQRGGCRRWLQSQAYGDDGPVVQTPAYFGMILTISNTSCKTARQRCNQHASHYFTDALLPAGWGLDCPVLAHVWHWRDVTRYVTQYQHMIGCWGRRASSSTISRKRDSFTTRVLHREIYPYSQVSQGWDSHAPGAQTNLSIDRNVMT